MWGNPFMIGVHGDRDACIAQYRTWLAGKLATDSDFLDPLRNAQGLACSCALHKACHADVLIEELEPPAPQSRLVSP